VALILASAHLLLVFFLLLLSVAWGSRMLGRLGFQTESHLEDALFSAGFFFASLEIALFVLEVVGWLRFATAATLLTLMALSAGRGWRDLRTHARSLSANTRESLRSVFSRFIGSLVAICLFLEVLLAMAPLTGSDALHYHFTTPLLEQGKSLTPIFWLMQSFYTGQAHLLISLGLSLGSDRISLGLMFLGGLLTVAALFAISRQLMSTQWAWITSLIFIATPLVYWQTSTSGSPDMWMAFYCAISTLAAARAVPSSAQAPVVAQSSARWLVLAGFFAGAAAGVKYTGWVIPFALVVYILAVQRSWRTASLSGIASLLAGIWPMARNWVWSGDPMFPFFMRFLNPSKVNSYSLDAFLSMSGAANVARDWQHLLGYPFLLVFNGNEHGLGQYYGPLVLAFSPLLAFAPWKKPVTSVAAFFWAAVYLSNLFSSQMGRLLLPVYALSLALVLSGVAAIAQRGWRIATGGCTASIFLFLVFAGASDALYARDFLPVIFGTEKDQAFLERMCPDYETSEFINRTLQQDVRPAAGSNVMVFFRHLYYIRVPFVDGSPEYSWQMDPALYSDPNKLLLHLREMNVRWVVKAPVYPEALAASFSKLEEEGKLAPIASTSVNNLTGVSRIYRQKQIIHVVLLKVAYPGT
jgi:hypothetical protein